MMSPPFLKWVPLPLWAQKLLMGFSVCGRHLCSEQRERSFPSPFPIHKAHFHFKGLETPSVPRILMFNPMFPKLFGPHCTESRGFPSVLAAAILSRIAGHEGQVLWLNSC